MRDEPKAKEVKEAIFEDCNKLLKSCFSKLPRYVSASFLGKLDLSCHVLGRLVADGDLAASFDGLVNHLPSHLCVGVVVMGRREVCKRALLKPADVVGQRHVAISIGKI